MRHFTRLDVVVIREHDVDERATHAQAAYNPHASQGAGVGAVWASDVGWSSQNG